MEVLEYESRNICELVVFEKNVLSCVERCIGQNSTIFNIIIISLITIYFLKICKQKIIKN